MTWQAYKVGYVPGRYPTTQCLPLSIGAIVPPFVCRLSFEVHGWAWSAHFHGNHHIITVKR
jgi:hypothetical protein